MFKTRIYYVYFLKQETTCEGETQDYVIKRITVSQGIV